jgi:hypothetical protein
MICPCGELFEDALQTTPPKTSAYRLAKAELDKLK